jgi:hypothetical protein
MFNTIVRAGAVGAGAGAATRYGSGSGSGSDQKMRLLAAPAPQHCFKLELFKNGVHWGTLQPWRISRRAVFAPAVFNFATRGVNLADF